MTSGDAHPKSDAGSGLTYRAAGVDIEAAGALVETIKPLAKATSRRGVIGSLGGVQFRLCGRPPAIGLGAQIFNLADCGLRAKKRGRVSG